MVSTRVQMTGDDGQRELIRQLLTDGLDTEQLPRAYEHHQVMAVVQRLRHLADDDLEGKLVVAGFTANPWGEGEDEQACDTCMYYAVHRRFCELPELMLAVDQKWSCRLWRI